MHLVHKAYKHPTSPHVRQLLVQYMQLFCLLLQCPSSLLPVFSQLRVYVYTVSSLFAMGWPHAGISGLATCRYIWAGHMQVYLGWPHAGISGLATCRYIWAGHMQVYLGWPHAGIPRLATYKYIWAGHMQVYLGWPHTSISGLATCRYIH